MRWSGGGKGGTGESVPFLIAFAVLVRPGERKGQDEGELQCLCVVVFSL